MASTFSWFSRMNRASRSTIGLNALSALVLLTASVPTKPTLDRQPEHAGEVQLGNQVWMAENLDVTWFRNGDLVPEAKSNQAWQKAAKDKQPAWCYYNNEARLGKTYGRLYNWYALHDPRGLCPPGWHAPSLGEWIQFEQVVAGRPATLLFECKGNQNQQTTNSSKGFCTLAGGYRFSDGSFTGLDEFTYLSGATEDSIEVSNRTWQPILWGRGLHVVDRTTMRCGLSKEFGLYVRCIKD